MLAIKVREQVAENEDESNKRKEVIKKKNQDSQRGMLNEYYNKLEQKRLDQLDRENLLHTIQEEEEKKNRPDPKTIKFDMADIMKDKVDFSAVLHFENRSKRSPSNTELSKLKLDELSNEFHNKSSE